MQRAETVVNREIASMRASLDRLGRLLSSAEPIWEMLDKIRKMPGLLVDTAEKVDKLRVATARTNSGAVATRTRPPASKGQLLWGKTLGLIRALPQSQRARVGGVAKQEGVKAAYRLAKLLRAEQDSPAPAKHKNGSEARLWGSRFAGHMGDPKLTKEQKEEAQLIRKEQGSKVAVAWLDKVKSQRVAAQLKTGDSSKSKAEVSLSRSYVAHRKSSSLTKSEKDKAEEIFKTKGAMEAVQYLEKVKKEKRGDSQATVGKT